MGLNKASKQQQQKGSPSSMPQVVELAKLENNVKMIT